VARRPAPHWQPITQLTFIGSLIEEAIADVSDTYTHLKRAEPTPHVLDDYTVNRVMEVYSEQQDDLWLYEDQLAYWLQGTLSPEQQEEVTRLVGRVDLLKQRLSSILALADKLKTGTIDAILGKSDLELALEVLSGQRPLPEPRKPPPPASLPNLTVNARFMGEFLAAPLPCCALGLVEVEGTECGLLALRPDRVIPSHSTDRGFRFGHSVLGTAEYEVVHFAFEFYGFTTYNVLMNPANPVVQAVLTRMMDTGDYFFFAVGSDHGALAFRSELEEHSLWGLQSQMPRLLQSRTTDEQYQRAVTAFAQNPEPPGTLLAWVCQDNTAALDLTRDRFDLTPRDT
jgi:hypothetical protein